MPSPSIEYLAISVFRRSCGIYELEVSLQEASATTAASMHRVARKFSCSVYIPVQAYYQGGMPSHAKEMLSTPPSLQVHRLLTCTATTATGGPALPKLKGRAFSEAVSIGLPAIGRFFAGKRQADRPRDCGLGLGPIGANWQLQWRELSSIRFGCARVGSGDVSVCHRQMLQPWHKHLLSC